MKKILFLIIILVSCSCISAQEHNATLVSKQPFDIKSVFGINIGDSKDSLAGKTDKPLPNKKDFAAALKESGMRLFGEDVWMCVAAIHKGKIKYIHVLFENAVGEKVADGFMKETLVMENPNKKKKGEYVAMYENCIVYFGYKKDGDFYAEFWSK